MPIYEYLCERCGKVHEVFQKLNEKPPSTCDECGARKLAKLVSRSAFQLKGGGWYSDLYASRKPAAGDGAGSGSTTGSSKGPEGEAKGATKAPSDASPPGTKASGAKAPGSSGSAKKRAAGD